MNALDGQVNGYKHGYSHRKGKELPLLSRTERQIPRSTQQVVTPSSGDPKLHAGVATTASLIQRHNTHCAFGKMLAL